MVELAKGLHVVDGLAQQGFLMNVVAVIEDDGSIHLIDCGLPGNEEKIFAYLGKQVRDPFNVKTLVLTHFDADHVGSAAAIKERTGCSILAHEFDGKIISGTRFTREELTKMFQEYSSEEIEALQRKIGNQKLPGVEIERALKGGERVGIGGGADVLHVPGHTPGHIVVFLPKLGAVVSGDSMTVPDGMVGPPTPGYTFSPRLAVSSLRKLADIKFDVLIPYHWPPLRSGGGDAVRKYVAAT